MAIYIKRRIVMAPIVKIYSTPTWPWCIKIKQWLEENKVSFENIDVSKDKVGREEMVNKTGQIAVPVIDIDGELAVGFDKNWLSEKLGIAQ